MVETAALEHRHLAIGLGVAVDLEHVEFGVRADVDHCEAHSLRGRRLDHRRRIEHLLVEREQPIDVVREEPHVVQAIEQHAVPPVGCERLVPRILGA